MGVMYVPPEELVKENALEEAIKALLDVRHMSSQLEKMEERLLEIIHEMEAQNESD